MMQIRTLVTFEDKQLNVSIDETQNLDPSPN